MPTYKIFASAMYGCPSHNFYLFAFRTYVGEVGSSWSRLVAASRIEWSLQHNAVGKLTKDFGSSKPISIALVGTFKTNAA